MDWPAPKRLHMLERFAGVTHIEFGAFVAMLQIEFTIPIIIAIFNLKIRKTEVSHIRDQLITNALPALFRNRPLLFFDKLVDEKIQFLAEVLREVITQKRNV